ncbi:Sugar transferase involved in LPS biosynthesis (colanic, teichoic acid) [Roseovarius nanhaiticus]|uniref:Sugar transferase involved in LPS biosynthesis (Colanic, teichoic acid) n=1 Tax=Roseovarius nanhaiticus TaxID=573024 RepID=A0A1N7EPL5_9RHOB|nr:sugar transferase [Roseovarius nanhaiticus]SEK69840.1 Sugar transferase involved in LPS biosynthesis (colanic, teichoic acid) [Roseovarius nanhaiticus]SIR90010.1 Sugar transferase involved in LPS biosynthesis (colanic, teichoic acid) [Roseovarius nanhaiticus]
MPLSKRLFDLVTSGALLLLLWPLLLLLAALILVRDGRPVFFVSERMKTPEVAFGLIKFRTMTHVNADSGVSGGDKAARLTRFGAGLRRTRLDELPQLWNVLRGDISLIGPRPPLRQYVAKFPDLYAQVLKSRPGITGLASLVYHAHEEKLLRPTASAAETDAVYSRACVPRKARIDLIYQRRRGLGLDLWILSATLSRVLR